SPENWKAPTPVAVRSDRADRAGSGWAGTAVRWRAGAVHWRPVGGWRAGAGSPVAAADAAVQRVAVPPPEWHTDFPLRPAVAVRSAPAAAVASQAVRLIAAGW